MYTLMVRVGGGGGVLFIYIRIWTLRDFSFELEFSGGGLDFTLEFYLGS